MARLTELRQAAEARLKAIQEDVAKLQNEIKPIDKDIEEKSKEKSIAAQDVVRDLTKQRGDLRSKKQVAENACSIISKALVKVRRAQDLGLEDVTGLHTETVKLTAFAASRLTEDESALDALQKATGNCDLSVEADSLTFVGAKDGIKKLMKAIEALESKFEMRVECDDASLLRIIDARDVMSALSKKHDGATLSRDGQAICIAGPPGVVKQAAKALENLMSGKEDIDCPKIFVGPAKAKAKEVEGATGAYLEVTGGGKIGKISIRGYSECVKDALLKIYAWLDEKEGATSEFVNVSKEQTEWATNNFDQFQSDLGHMAQKFGIWVKPINAKGDLELRGPPDAVAAAKDEMKQIMDYYQKKTDDAVSAVKAKGKGRSKEQAPPEPEQDDGWGAAPEADSAPFAWK